MEATYKHESGIIQCFEAASALSPGQVVVRDERIGVVSGCSPIAVGDDYTLITDGVFDMAATSADEWADGDLLYWDDTTNKLTDTAGSNKKAGLAIGDKAASVTTADCDINKRQ